MRYLLNFDIFINLTNIERMYYEGTGEPTSMASGSRPTSCRGQASRKTVALHHRNIGQSKRDPYRHGLPDQIFVRGLAYLYQPGIIRAYRDRPLCRARILIG